MQAGRQASGGVAGACYTHTHMYTLTAVCVRVCVAHSSCNQRAKVAAASIVNWHINYT